MIAPNDPEPALSIRIRDDQVRIVRRPQVRDLEQAGQMAQYIAVQFRNLAEAAGLDIGESLDMQVDFTVPGGLAFEARHPMFRDERVREIMRATAESDGDEFEVAP